MKAGPPVVSGTLLLLNGDGPNDTLPLGNGAGSDLCDGSLYRSRDCVAAFPEQLGNAPIVETVRSIAYPHWQGWVAVVWPTCKFYCKVWAAMDS